MATATPQTNTGRRRETDEATPIPVDQSRTPYDAKVAAFAAVAAQTLARNRDVLLDALAASGIETVVVRFDGKNGYGQIEAMDAYTADETMIALPVIDLAMQEPVFTGPSTAIERRTLRGAVEIMSHTLLERSHGTWAAGNGGYGELTFEVSRRSVTLEYNKRVMMSVRLRRWL